MPKLLSFSPNSAEAILEVMAEPSQEVAAVVERLLARPHPFALSPAAAAGFAGGAPPGGALPAPRRASLLVQLGALSARHLRLSYRHPLLIGVNLLATAVVSVLVGVAFWQVDPSQSIHFGSGVMQRVGLLFFVGIYFILTSLVGLGMWQQERLIYFHEHAAGCYGALSYLASRLFFDVVPLRLLPALLATAIIYPMAGLRHDAPFADWRLDHFSRWPGPAAASMFVAGLCLVNLVAATMASCIGIVCDSAGVGTMLGVLLTLFTMLLCGLLVNGDAPQQDGWVAAGAMLCAWAGGAGAGWLSRRTPALRHCATTLVAGGAGGGMALGGWLMHAHVAGAVVRLLPSPSYLYYFIEMVLFNELHDQLITIDSRTDIGKSYVVQGKEVLAQLGYGRAESDWQSTLYGSLCALDMPCASVRDLTVLSGWALVCVVFCYFLLRFCVRDPH